MKSSLGLRAGLLSLLIFAVLVGLWQVATQPTAASGPAMDPEYAKLVGAAAATGQKSSMPTPAEVGATIWNSASNTSSDFYSFDASSYSHNYSLVRSVRLSLIGRTPPNQSGPNNFQNNFDGGNYQIQAISIAVNPRNLSMRD